MELLFVAVLVLVMAGALAAGFPVAFALPGSAILTIGLAALCGYVFAGDISAYFYQGGPVEWLSAGVTNFRGVYWEVERDTLIAIPLFVFMGIMLQRSRIAEDLLVTMAQLFGPVPGGLGISVVLVGALLAATTGIVGATVVAMGLISLPAMLRNNYSKPLATGTICASGTLGQIIPPSIVLIILADQLSNATDQASTLRKAEYKHGTGETSLPSAFEVSSTSAGDMFLGAFLPGLVLVGLYVLSILAIALFRPHFAPPVPYAGKYDWRFALRVLLALVPPLTLILAVLGSIILGIATVNQAGAIGAIGATIMAGYRLHAGRRDAFYPAILAIVSLVALFFLLSSFNLNVKAIHNVRDFAGVLLAGVAVLGLVVAILWSAWRTLQIEDTLRGVMLETAKTTSMVFIILLGAAMLTAAFRSFGGEVLVREFLTGLPGGFWSQMIVVMAVIFVLGFFLDFIEIAVVVVPIVAPILLSDPSANITAVWLGVMIGVNIQTSFLTPPFGFALFYLRGVASRAVKTLDIYRGVVAFIVLQLVALAIVGVFPPLVNYLPYRTSLLAETAPPPVNPRLQLCLERDLFAVYDERREELLAAIGAVRELDAGALPDRVRSEFDESLEKASTVFERIAEIRAAERALNEFSVVYRPLHREVRSVQREIREFEAVIERDRQRLRRLVRAGLQDGEEAAAADAEIHAFEKEIAVLSAEIPTQWEESRTRFMELAEAEEKARRVYRRSVDDAYEFVVELQGLIGSGEALAAQVEAIATIAAEVETADPAASHDQLRAIERSLNKVAGSSGIRSSLSKARRSLGKNPKPNRAVKPLQEAAATAASESVWRIEANKALSSGLASYEEAIRDTIGLRQQDRLPRDNALAVAGCLSSHRDISLYF